jgi:hypothetical protein
MVVAAQACDIGGSDVCVCDGMGACLLQPGEGCTDNTQCASHNCNLGSNVCQ